MDQNPQPVQSAPGPSISENDNTTTGGAQGQAAAPSPWELPGTDATGGGSEVVVTAIDNHLGLSKLAIDADWDQILDTEPWAMQSVPSAKDVGHTGSDVSRIGKEPFARQALELMAEFKQILRA